MSTDIKETLEKLQTGDLSLIEMRRRLLRSIDQSATSFESLHTLMDELQKRYQLPSCQNFHNQAFYSVLIGTVYLNLEEKQKAINWYGIAECQFRNQGEVWNQCLVLKIMGLAYLSATDHFQATCSFEKAQHLLKEEIRLYKNEYSTDYQELTADLDGLIKKARQSPPETKKIPQVLIHTSPKPAPPPHP